MLEERIFTGAMNGVAPLWLLLGVAPRWRVTRLLVHSALPALLLGGLYAAVLVLAHPGAEGGGFGSLQEVSVLFSDKRTLLAGWLHYLCFDLFVGAWITRDAERRAISHWLVLPCLYATLMLGPIGLLAYLALRAALRRTFTLFEDAPALPTSSPAAQPTSPAESGS